MCFPCGSNNTYAQDVRWAWRKKKIYSKQLHTKLKYLRKNKLGEENWKFKKFVFTRDQSAWTRSADVWVRITCEQPSHRVFVQLSETTSFMTLSSSEIHLVDDRTPWFTTRNWDRLNKSEKILEEKNSNNQRAKRDRSQRSVLWAVDLERRRKHVRIKT